MKQLLFLFGLHFLLAACAPNFGDETAVSNTPATLDGTAWILTDFQGVTLIPGIDVTAEFADGQISGTAGCNRYGGAYTVDGSSFSVGEIAFTAQECLQPMMALETHFKEALLTATAVSLDNDTLTMDTGAGTLTFVPQTAAALEETRWVLNGVPDNTTGAIISTWVDEHITAQFVDGQLSGSAGCNRYNGSYTLDGDNLSLGPIAATKMACDEERNQREAGFLQALSQAAAYSTDRNSLTLTDAEGKTLLTFRRQEPLAPAQLFDAVWQLVSVETPDGPLPAQSADPVTMQFTPDIIAGFSGCIRYTAGYHLAPEAFLLLVGDASTSARGCRGGAGQLEQTFFNLLQTAASFTLEADTLTIFTADGTLSFTPMGFTDYAPHVVALPDGTTCSLTTADDPVTVNGRQRRYFCFQSGEEQVVLTGELQPQENGWQTEMAVLRGSDDNFEIMRTEAVTITLPTYGPGER